MVGGRFAPVDLKSPSCEIVESYWKCSEDSSVSNEQRTVVLSTHLIDEVSNLLEHVLAVIDEGRIVIDSDADALRGSAVTVAGTASAVDAFTRGREVLHRERLGGLATATVPALDEPGRREAARAGLELAPVSLQQLVIRTTTMGEDPS